MPDPDTLPAGKLPLGLLTQLLAPLTPRDPRVRVGARAGEDAAIIDLGERLLVAAADPITFATDQIGRYAVAVNANDVAVRGATARWFLATLLLPAGTTRAGVQAEGAAEGARLGQERQLRGRLEVDPDAGGRSELGQRRGQPALGGIVHGVRLYGVAQGARHGDHGDAGGTQQVGAPGDRRRGHAARLGPTRWACWPRARCW